MLPAGEGAQSAGSAITYARRYLLCAVLNIAADEDDDGAKASKKTKPKEDWGKKVEAPKVSEPGDNQGEGRTGSESTSPGGEDGEATVTSSPPPGDELDDDPAPTWLWKEATSAGLTGARALKAAVAGVKQGTLPGPEPSSQSEITGRQLGALITKLGAADGTD